MIEIYELKSLLKKYGIDASKVVSKNDTILERGEYQDIDRTLNYLVNELGINPRNIEKCPSVMYHAVDNIRGNYEFLIKQGVNISSIETALHILNTEPNILKETYYYVLDNYGKEYINRFTTILRTSVNRIKVIEKLLSDKTLIISVACFKKNIDEIERIIAVCQKNNIPVTSSVFYKTADEIEQIIDVCKKNNIPITGTVFHRTANEIEKIVSVCKKSNIPITGTVFHRTADEIEEIVVVCKNNNIPITSTLFLKTADEIEKIIVVCNENKILITGSIFMKNADELEESINYVKSTYGETYLKPLIVNKNVEYLKVVLPYLDSLNVLPVVIKSASILTLTLEEIIERKEYIESIGEKLVLSNGRFNSIFGMTRANYRKLIGKKEECLRLCRK